MQQDFLLNGRIPCRVAALDGAPIRRIVLGVHGLGGSMHDEIQAGIAEEMTLFGAVSYRFDFPCHGAYHKDGPLDLQECMQTLLAVATEASKQHDVQDLCIFATGFGAYVTLLSLPQLQQLPQNIRLVIQTPNVCMHATLLSMLRISRETLRAMDRFTIPAEQPFEIDYHFYEELLASPAITTYEIPMLILQGQADDYINMSDIRNLRAVNEDAKLVIIPGTSHRFLEDGAWDMVLDLTRDWFAFQQVLVTEWE